MRKYQPNLFHSVDNSYVSEYKLLVSSTFKRFCQTFPTEESCWDKLYRLMNARGMVYCRGCLSARVVVKKCRRKLRCQDCRKSYSLTAKTFFNRVRKLKAWFAAIWLTEEGAFVSSNWFASLLDIAQSSALHIQHSVLGAIDSHRKSQGGERCLVSTEHFIDLFIRNSLVTPRWEHPAFEEAYEQSLIAAEVSDEVVDTESGGTDFGSSSALSPAPETAQDELEQGVPEQVSAESIESVFNTLFENEQYAVLNEFEKSILKLLVNGKLSTDRLSSALSVNAARLSVGLTELELCGLIEELPGGMFKLTDMVQALLDLAGLGGEHSGSAKARKERCAAVASGGVHGSFGESENPDDDEHSSADQMDSIQVDSSGLSGLEQSELRYVKRKRRVLTSLFADECGNSLCQGCTNDAVSSSVRQLVSSFRTYTLVHFQGIARKHLQLYLSLQQYRSRRVQLVDFLGQGRVGKLQEQQGGEDRARVFSICLETGYLGSRLIRGYLTPLLAELPVPAV
ncbi:MAG: hypothetical protein IPK73_25120 [Candidatus Obscuribacter sp.]|nr:hypothetical protein [Candidatus Obscuribacter sp.]MBK9277399.1 hypothetical protein [Candidatus Obscuribacter sp.]